MNMQFNQEQMQAISSNNHSLIISAAAGSGKTTVLIEKIIHQIIQYDKAISSMLIITFTREAAANMRIKLKEKLDERYAQYNEEKIAVALSQIESAQISTIHSFCSSLLRDHFEAVSIDPMYRISEGSETDPLFEEAYRSAVEACFDEEKSSVSKEIRDTLNEIAAVYSQDQIQKMVLELYHKMMGLPDPLQLAIHNIEHLDAKDESNPWILESRKCMELDLLALQEYVAKAEELFQDGYAIPKCREIYEEDTKLILPLLNGISGKPLQEVQEVLISAHEKWTKMVKPRKCSEEETVWYEQFKHVRDTIQAGKKGIIPEVLENIKNLINEEYLEANKAIKKEAEALINLTWAVKEQFFALKKQINILDFEDLEQLTYQLLTDPELQIYRKDIQAKYSDIFVDESQDISAIQNAIIQQIHGEENMLTMVGDVKQSIYRFRHADPSLFLYYRDHYADEENAWERRIFFRSNYRSSSNVVEAVNQVFRASLRREINELDYTVNDELVHGKADTTSYPVDIILIGKDKEIDTLEAECVQVAEKIHQLIGTTYTDSKGKVSTYTYRDMAILMRSAKDKGPKAVEYFKKLHIPVYYDGGESYYGLTEVMSVLSILQTIDNFLQDTPLIATLKSPAFHFSDEELAEIRIHTPEHVPFHEAFDRYIETEENKLSEKCKNVRETVKAWKFLSQTMKITDFIWYLIRTTAIYAHCGSYRDGDLRQANLRLFCKKAMDYEQNINGTFGEFVALIKDIASGASQQKDSDAIGYLSSSDDVVRLMTMHKSKGLEYPIVFLLGLETRLTKPGNSGPMQIDLGVEEDESTHMGIYLPKVNGTYRSYMHTFGKDAFAGKARKNELAEQARLLYVAMTRAMEKLILVAEYNEKSAPLWEAETTEYRIWNSKTMLDLVMPGVLKNTEDDLWNIVKVEAQGIPEEEEEISSGDITGYLMDRLEVEDRGSIPSFAQDEARKNDPAKTTVTSIAVAMEKEIYMESSLTEEDIELKRSPHEIVPMMLSSEASKPKFMDENTRFGAERGTQTHRFLSLIDIGNMNAHPSLLEWVKSEKRRMIDQGIFTSKDMRMIQDESIVNFFTSELGIRMAMAEEIKREWQFIIQVDGEGSTAMQGVIDAAFFERDAWVIVDYKTEYIADVDAFVRKHTVQLNLYRQAIERLTHMPVSEIWLYSLGLKRAFPVTRTDII